MANFEFVGYQICRQTVYEINIFHLHFQIKSNLEGRNNEFKQGINSEVSEELLSNKNKLNTSFDYGFVLNGKDQEEIAE